VSSAWTPATTADAIVAMRWLAAIAVALGTVELWRVRRVADDDGVWRWSTLRREWPAPLAALLTVVHLDGEAALEALDGVGTDLERLRRAWTRLASDEVPSGE